MAAVASFILYVAAALFGICIFSFVNVLIYRIPRKLNWATGRSMCTSCEHQLSALDLVPVFSWLALGHKCRYCGEPISARYAVVELFGGLFALLSVIVFGWTWAALMCFALCLLMTTIAFIDLDTKTIPNGLVIATAVLGAVDCILQLTGVGPLVDISWIDRLIGILVGGGILLVIALPTGGFGGGDIKLMAALGLLLGWQLTLLTLFGGVLLGGAYGVSLLIRKKAEKGDSFAFGPFLTICAIMSVTYGHQLIGLYLGVFGLA